MNGTAPNRSVTGFHSDDERKPKPNFSLAGELWIHNSATSRIVTARIETANSRVKRYATSSPPKRRLANLAGRRAAVEVAIVDLMNQRDLLLFFRHDRLWQRSIAESDTILLANGHHPREEVSDCFFLGGIRN